MEIRPRADRDSIDEIYADADAAKITETPDGQVTLQISERGSDYCFHFRSESGEGTVTLKGFYDATDEPTPTEMAGGPWNICVEQLDPKCFWIGVTPRGDYYPLAMLYATAGNEDGPDMICESAEPKRIK